jgi:Fur family ferric uptake transcriptional regulator
MSCGDRLAKDLREAGYRVTPQRAVILESIAHNQGHHSAPEVFSIARRRLPGLNLATVYRTLDSLHQAGLVDLLPGNGSELVRFSLHEPDHLHAHLVCRSCGDIREIGPDEVDRMAAALEQATGFRVDVAHLTLVGLCSRCAARL